MGSGFEFTKREWFLLCGLICVDFTSAMCASLQAPFYPPEAEKKGVTAIEYGMVFGVFELVAFITSPLFGKYMGQLGVKFVLCGGVLVAGLSTIMFGFLDIVNEHPWFISVSFLVRILESLGTSAAITATLSIIRVVYTESFAIVFTALEISQGVGYMLGPTVGGYLYAIGGFTTPFAVVGVLVLLVGSLVFFALESVEDTYETTKPRTAIFTVLKITPVLLDALSVFINAMSIGFLSATLEPHLRSFELSPVAIGGMFVISVAVYTMVAPVIGVICSRQVNLRKLILLGSLTTIVSFCLIGPVPFTPIAIQLWMVCLGLVLDGVGMALMFVPSFVDAIQSVVAHGLPDDLSTYAIVSGIYASSFALGAFIGPVVAGILLELVGFRQGTLFVIAAHTILYFVTTWTLCIDQQDTVQISCTPTPDMKRRGQFSASWSHDNDWDTLIDDDKKRASQRNESNALAGNTNSSMNKANYGTLCQIDDITDTKH